MEIYTRPDENSEVAAKVPGGVQLEVIEDAGDWWLVKLLGGKQGYISKDDAKE
ncbi:SH3 domain-containing protein [candidate division GN15 bacterium]|nr:SH3 domain-containing protein [candidate division GN15 bacterium]